MRSWFLACTCFILTTYGSCLYLEWWLFLIVLVFLGLANIRCYRRRISVSEKEIEESVLINGNGYPYGSQIMKDTRNRWFFFQLLKTWTWIEFKLKTVRILVSQTDIKYSSTLVTPSDQYIHPQSSDTECKKGLLGLKGNPTQRRKHPRLKQREKHWKPGFSTIVLLVVTKSSLSHYYVNKNVVSFRLLHYLLSISSQAPRALKSLRNLLVTRHCSCVPVSHLWI